MVVLPTRSVYKQEALVGLDKLCVLDVCRRQPVNMRDAPTGGSSAHLLSHRTRSLI